MKHSETHKIQKGYVVLIKSQYFGAGSDELGTILMRAYFKSVLQSDCYPEIILFLNSGIFLTNEDSPVLEAVQDLEERGVMILSCGTCLDFFQKKQGLRVGKITNFQDTVKNLNSADKILTV